MPIVLQKLQQQSHELSSLSTHRRITFTVNGRKTNVSSLSVVVLGMTLVVITFATMESSNYLKSIQYNTEALQQRLELSGLYNEPAMATPSDVFSNETGRSESMIHTRSQRQPLMFQNDHPLCQKLTFPIETEEATESSPSSQPLYNANVLNAGNLWHSYWETILHASYYPLFAENKTHVLDDANQNIYKNLFMDLSPSHLEEGLMTRPQAEQIERIWTKLEERRVHPTTAPPLRVLVMGGSVVEGVGCIQHQEGIERDLLGRDCAWPARLEAFVNTMLGYDAIQVVNIAQGGTGTSQALSIVKYWMYPPQLEGNAPDIIIHAFGSNDSHLGEVPPTEQERIMQLHQQGTERLNQFIQSVFKSHACPTPIVLHLDDYFGGHRQGALLGDFTYRMILKEVAGWYGNMAVSSAQVVDGFIYPDTMGETAFSPKWYIKQRGPTKGQYNENVHFGFGGHLAVVWTWAYSALKATVHFCNDKDWEQHRSKNEQKQFDNTSRKRDSFTKDNVHLVKGFMPPPLNYDMDLQNISQAMLLERKRQEDHCATISESPPCTMAFTAGPEGQTSTADLLSRYLEPWLTHRDGFTFERDMSHGFARKLGVAAMKANATMRFDFRNLTDRASILTIHSLKSYGEAWEGSAAKFSIFKKGPVVASGNATVHEEWVELQNKVLSGVHNSISTISYSTEMAFPPIEEGSDVKLEVALVGGSKFKITGMMLCSR